MTTSSSWPTTTFDPRLLEGLAGRGVGLGLAGVGEVAGQVPSAELVFGGPLDGEVGAVEHDERRGGDLGVEVVRAPVAVVAQATSIMSVTGLADSISTESPPPAAVRTPTGRPASSLVESQTESRRPSPSRSSTSPTFAPAGMSGASPGHPAGGRELVLPPCAAVVVVSAPLEEVDIIVVAAGGHR